MNLGTAFVLAIVVAIVLLALWATFKKKGSCSCEGGCSGCSSAKTYCPAEKAEELVASDFGLKG